MKSFFALSICATLLVGSFSSSLFAQKKEKKKSEKKSKSEIVVIETNMGKIELKMFRKEAPKTVENFVQLAKKGYYNGIIFHRVIDNFMIQGGDPTGTGSGGESIYGRTFNDEINKDSQLYKTGYKSGIVAMANAGPNTNGSQFFICLIDVQLPPSYTIFGEVVAGMDVVKAIGKVKTGANDKPVKDVVMKKVYVK